MQKLRIKQGLQPLGFALFLLYFIIPNKAVSIPLFWAGILFSVAGSIVEIQNFLKLPAKRKKGKFILVIPGIIVKILLIVSIALRVYEVKYSVFILLGVIVLAIIWSAFSVFYKPHNASDEGILDAPE